MNRHWRTRFYFETEPVRHGDVTLRYVVDARHAVVRSDDGREAKITTLEACIIEQVMATPGREVPLDRCLPWSLAATPKSRASILRILTVALSTLRSGLATIGSRIDVRRVKGRGPREYGGLIADDKGT